MLAVVFENYKEPKWFDPWSVECWDDEKETLKTLSKNNLRHITNLFMDDYDIFNEKEEQQYLKYSNVAYHFSDFHTFYTGDTMESFIKEEHMSDFIEIPFDTIIFCANIEFPYTYRFQKENYGLEIETLRHCKKTKIENFWNDDENYYVWKTNVIYTNEYECPHACEDGCRCRPIERTFVFPALYVSYEKDRIPLEKEYISDSRCKIIFDEWELVKQYEIDE